jgi:hypothetical protein
MARGGHGPPRSHLGPPCSTLLHPTREPPLKRLYGRFRGGPPAKQAACSCLIIPWTPHAVRLGHLTLLPILTTCNKRLSSCRITWEETDRPRLGLAQVGTGFKLTLRTKSYHTFFTKYYLSLGHCGPPRRNGNWPNSSWTFNFDVVYLRRRQNHTDSIWHSFKLF